MKHTQWVLLSPHQICVRVQHPPHRAMHHMIILNLLLYHYHNVPVPRLKLAVTSQCQKHSADSGSTDNMCCGEIQQKFAIIIHKT